MLKDYLKYLETVEIHDELQEEDWNEEDVQSVHYIGMIHGFYFVLSRFEDGFAPLRSNYEYHYNFLFDKDQISPVESPIDKIKISFTDKILPSGVSVKDIENHFKGDKVIILDKNELQRL